ncbi:hypothetical protein A3A37_01035 [Candidatus Kaiserbacteria bacterium RIFCSPLOWO2_01_FULL_52_36]|nr:MAG: hypothetical protein A3A37_01035 [Candidatus Kaiserbacteria bacterium RIFCSPLOWO2_01_FULL_52_36]
MDDVNTSRNFTTGWAVIIGFLSGVFVRSFFLLGSSVVGFTALLAVAGFLFSYIERTKKPLIILSVALIAFASGILRMNNAVLVGDPELTARLGTEITIEGTVSDEPDVRENGVRISLSADKLMSATSTAIHAGVLVVAPAHTNILYGDRVRATGTLRIPQDFDTGTGRQFNYPEYLAKDGIGYELAFASVERIVAENEGNILKRGAIWVKQKFLDGLGRSLSEPQAGLAGGITVGAKRGLGAELTDAFKTVGLVHIVVLSGYNITVVMDALWWALAGFPRAFGFAGSAFVAVFFALMTGGAASSVRAAAMALIAITGRMTGRVYLASRALGAVAFAMVLWNPFILAFDPGFQLSALATLGLIWFTPLFISRLSAIPEKFGLREIAATTLGTQIAVLPLLLYQNGQLPIFSLPANLLALVAVPAAMFFSAIAALGGIALGPLAPIVAFPAYVLLSYIIDVAKIFAGLPFSSLAIGAFSAWWMFIAYAVIVGVLIHIHKRNGWNGSSHS